MRRSPIAVFMVAALLATLVDVSMAQTPPAPAAGTPPAPAQPGAKPPGAPQPGAPQPGAPPAAAKPGAPQAPPAPPAVPSKTYRWVDKKGVVNYSDTPPPAEFAPPPAAETKGGTEPKAGAAVSDEKAERKRLQTIDELLTLAGVKRALEQLPATLRTQETPKQVSAKDREALLRVLGDAFSTTSFYPLIRESFRARFDEQLAEAVFTWYRSPLAKKLVRLELESITPKAQQELAGFAEKLRSQPPTEPRLELIDRLDSATGLTETKLEMAAAMLGVVQKVVTPLLPIDQRPKPGDLERLMARIRSAQRQGAKQASLLTLLFTYRAVPDAELQQYVEFGESEGGRWFLRTARTSMMDAMGSAAEKAMREIVRTAAAPPAPGPAPARR